MMVGDRKASWENLVFETLLAGVVGGIGGTIFHAKGINVGSHSWHQIYSSGLSKVWSYGWNISVKTMAKGFAMSLFENIPTMIWNTVVGMIDDSGILPW